MNFEETSIRFNGDFLSTVEAVLIKRALDKSLAMDTKVPSWIRDMSGMSGRKYRYFINGLIGSLPAARYLEVGSWAGSTACSAMFENKVAVTCIDNWSEFGGPREQFLENVERAKGGNVKFDFIESDFNAVNFQSIGVFNVYLFDGPHTHEEQYNGIVLAQPALDNLFILVVDDFNWPYVRSGTMKAIEDLGLHVECSVEIRTTQNDTHPTVLTMENSDWHNGYFFAVVKKAAL